MILLRDPVSNSMRRYAICRGENIDKVSSINVSNFSAVIPQTCRYKSKKFECGLSISCVLSGGKPMDLCSGGMVWSCCVDILQSSNDEEISQPGSINNASEYHTFYRK